ncbi:MAG TPA: hypothetical protein VJ324_14475, partial [Candidatus Acidoferrum sp.]|nr:hypothetical protein [Candidatus Acidoferrum sp.]
WTGPLSRGDYGVVAAHLDAMKDLPAQYAHAYEAVNCLAALVLAQDSSRMLAELDKVKLNKKSRVKATGGQA